MEILAVALREEMLPCNSTKEKLLSFLHFKGKRLMERRSDGKYSTWFHKDETLHKPED